MDFLEDLFEDVFDKKKHKRHKGHYYSHSGHDYNHYPNGEREKYEQRNFCPRCSAGVQQGAKFCSNCGSAVNTAMHCSNCGVKLAPDVNFCSECGTKTK